MAENQAVKLVVQNAYCESRFVSHTVGYLRW